MKNGEEVMKHEMVDAELSRKTADEAIAAIEKYVKLPLCAWTPHTKSVHDISAGFGSQMFEFDLKPHINVVPHYHKKEHRGSSAQEYTTNVSASLHADYECGEKSAGQFVGSVNASFAGSTGGSKSSEFYSCCEQYQMIQINLPSPMELQELLKPVIKNALMTADCDHDFFSSVGMYYCKSITYGAAVIKATSVEKSSTFSSANLSSQVDLAYVDATQKGQVKGNCTIQSTSSDHAEDMRLIVDAYGSDPRFYHEGNMTAWKNNAFLNPAPITVSLMPIYHLISDPERKKQVKEEWTKLAQCPDRFSHFPDTPHVVKAKIVTLAECGVLDRIKDRINNHNTWLDEQASEAQGWINNWTSGFDVTRNRNWKAQADWTQAELKDFMRKYCLPQVATEVFLKVVGELIKKFRDAESVQVTWGINGHDGVKAGEMQRAAIDCLRDIEKMLD